MVSFSVAPSFQQLEAELAQPALQRWIGADRAFHDDVLRYSLSGFLWTGLQSMLVGVNRTLKRNKAFDAGHRLTLAWANKLAVLEAPSFRVIARRTLPGTEQPQKEDYVFAASFSPDANQVVTATSAGEISSHAVAGIADTVLYRARSLFAAALSPGATFDPFV